MTPPSWVRFSGMRYPTMERPGATILVEVLGLLGVARKVRIKEKVMLYVVLFSPLP